MKKLLIFVCLAFCIFLGALDSGANLKIANAETLKKLAIAEAKAPIEKERDRLANDLENKTTQAKLREAAIVEKYKGAIELRDEEIERLKDMKAKLSTKMVGETLEQH